FREGLELVLGLRSDIEIVGAAEDGGEAVELARELRPDVVLMDYRLPGMDGVEATAAVLAAYPGAAVIGLTASANLRERQALSDAGAVYSLHIAGALSGTVESARAAASELGDRVRVVDTETASAAVAMLGLAIQRRLERGTTVEEVEALVRRHRRDSQLIFTLDTLDYLA